MGKNLAGAVASYVDGKPMNVSSVCADLGISRKTFYKYVHRFERDGVGGFFPDSRRPRSTPTRLDAASEDVLIAIRKAEQDAGWDYGADAVLLRLQEQHRSWPIDRPLPSRATINRVFDARGLIVKVPQRKPKKSRRFEMAAPNQMWQIDGFDAPLAGGRKAVVLHIVDDCSRTHIALTAAVSENSTDVWSCFCAATAEYGLPARLLSDNGTAFSGRRRGWTSDLEANCHTLGIQHIAASVSHPQTCGKDERGHQRVLKWLAKQPTPNSLDELQVLLDDYRSQYNNRRNMVLENKLTPHQRFELGPIDSPNGTLKPRCQATTAHVSDAGCIAVDSALIGIGKRHRHQSATVFRTIDDVSIFIGKTLIRELVIDRSRHYQPQTR